MLAPKVKGADDKEIVTRIMEALKVNKDNWQIGLTKVFMRNSVVRLIFLFFFSSFSQPFLPKRIFNLVPAPGGGQGEAHEQVRRHHHQGHCRQLPPQAFPANEEEHCLPPEEYVVFFFL